MELPPEYRLLRACARRAASDEAQALIRSLAPSIHWPTLLLLAARHRMLPRLHHHLARTAADTPPVVASLLGSLAGLNAGRNLFLAAELARITRAAADAGVDLLAFKGPVQTLQLEGDMTQRTMGDLDILVRERGLGAARTLLEACGYEHRSHTVSPWSYHLGYRHRSHGLDVELHWRLSLNTRFPNLLPTADLTAHAVSVPVQGTSVRALHPHHMLLMLSVHGLKHGWRRIGWIADILQWLDRYDTEDLSRATDMADGYGMSGVLRVALLIAWETAGESAPASLDHWLKDARARRISSSLQEERRRDACAIAARAAGVVADSTSDLMILLDASMRRTADSPVAAVAVDEWSSPEEKHDHFSSLLYRRRHRLWLWSQHGLYRARLALGRCARSIGLRRTKA